MSELMNRFFDLRDGLRAEKPRPESQTSAFAAAALIHSPGDVPELLARTRATRGVLEASRGRARAPHGAMAWLHGAILVAGDADPQAYLGAIGQLRERERVAKAGGLYARGSRAALVLSVGGATDAASIDRFFKLKKALRPPWWRSDASVTDTFAAAHALDDRSGEEILAARDRAERVFGADAKARGYKRDGARLTVLLRDAPEAVLGRFHALEEARRANPFVRRRVSRGLAMDWAASGQSVADLPAIESVLEAMPRQLASAGYARARLAHLIACGDKSEGPVESAMALAAVQAAQAAMMAAIVASTTAATTATSAS